MLQTFEFCDQLCLDSSLTTFSSWNSEMVILMLGAGHRQSLVFRGLLGYFIGIETGLGMYIFLS